MIDITALFNKMAELGSKGTPVTIPDAAIVAIAEQLERIADHFVKSDKFDLQLDKLRGVNARAISHLHSLSRFDPDAHGDLYRNFAKKAFEELKESQSAEALND